MKFAAYDNSAIYAIGDTPNETAARACQDAGDPQARFKIARITNEFAAQIAECGWDRHCQTFEVGRNGYLTETT
jgi:hypothetical protein